MRTILVAAALVTLAGTGALAQGRYWYEQQRRSPIDRSWTEPNSQRMPDLSPSPRTVSPLQIGSGKESGGPARELVPTTGSTKKHRIRTPW